MKKYIAAILFLFSINCFSQSAIDKLILKISPISASSTRMAMVDSFMTEAQKKGIPLVEGEIATFIYSRKATSVLLAGDMNGWRGEKETFTQLAGTDFFYYQKKYELNARLDYKLVIDDKNWILDPLNPKTCSGGFGPNSELAMTDYIQPQEITVKQESLKGKVISDSISSLNTGKKYFIKIYLPYDYSAESNKKYPTVYFQDGGEYVSVGFALNILDNLISEKKIEPVIAVFVSPTNRNEEYAFGLKNEYQLFFADELVHYMDNSFKTFQTPEKRLVIGDSYGGNISALIAYNHSDIFGNCGLHSGAFQENDFETYKLITNGPKKKIKWFSVWGTYEGLWKNMRSFRDFLKSAGYISEHHEYPEGHSWGLWRANTDSMLEYFFPFTGNN